MLSYFGCDQSQVQRYLTAKSVNEARQSLLMSAFVKIPLQALVLMTGVCMFAVLRLQPAADAVQPGARRRRSRRARARRTTRRSRPSSPAGVRARAGPPPTRWRTPSRAEHDAARAAVHARRPRRCQGRPAAGGAGSSRRSPATTKYKDVTGDTPRPTSTTSSRRSSRRSMPIGLVGLIIAAIFAAAMSSIAAELNSLGDRHGDRRLQAPADQARSVDAHYLRVSKLGDACLGPRRLRRGAVAVRLGSLIEVVNRFGSIFYGSLLGVFVLALDVQARQRPRRVRRPPRAASASCSPSRSIRATKSISFLWHNPLGVVVVVVVGMAVSLMTKPPTAPGTAMTRPARCSRGSALASRPRCAAGRGDASARQPARYDLAHRRRHRHRRHRPRRASSPTSRSRTAGSRRSAGSRGRRPSRSIDASGLIVVARLHRRPYARRRSGRSARGRQLRPHGRDHHRRRQLRRVRARRRRRRCRPCARTPAPSTSRR